MQESVYGRGVLVREEVRAGVERALMKKSSHPSREIYSKGCMAATMERMKAEG